MVNMKSKSEGTGDLGKKPLPEKEKSQAQSSAEEINDLINKRKHQNKVLKKLIENIGNQKSQASNKQKNK